MNNPAPKEACPFFLHKSQGVHEARIGCRKPGYSMVSMSFKYPYLASKEEEKAVREQRDSYHTEHCCGNYKACKRYHTLEALR